jgi:hypothetical protein
MALASYAVALAFTVGYVVAMALDVIASADEVDLSTRLQAAKLPPADERREIRLKAGATLREVAAEVSRLTGETVTIPAIQRLEGGAKRVSRVRAIAYRHVLDSLRGVA